MEQRPSPGWYPVISSVAASFTAFHVGHHSLGLQSLRRCAKKKRTDASRRIAARHRITTKCVAKKTVTTKGSINVARLEQSTARRQRQTPSQEIMDIGRSLVCQPQDIITENRKSPTREQENNHLLLTLICWVTPVVQLWPMLSDGEYRRGRDSTHTARQGQNRNRGKIMYLGDCLRPSGSHRQWVHL